MPDAPVEVIKASYRVLSQKYHPDRNQDPEALRLMKAINQAWDVLSDPERRSTHDRWIAEQEQRALQGSARRDADVTKQADVPETHRPEPQQARAGKAKPVPRSRADRKPARFPLLRELGDAASDAWRDNYGVRVAGMGAAALVIFFGGLEIHQLYRTAAAELADDALPVAKAKLPARPENGATFYHDSDPGNGPASFTLDNTAGQSDVEVKLLRDGQPYEDVYVHAGKSNETNNIKRGTYTVKYKILAPGKPRTLKSVDSFPLQRTEQEARENRYNKFNKIRVTRFDLAAGKSVEIEAAQY